MYVSCLETPDMHKCARARVCVCVCTCTCHALTVCVHVAGVQCDGALVQVVLCVALLRVPLGGRLVAAVTRAVDAALVGVGHLYHPGRETPERERGREGERQLKEMEWHGIRQQ